MEKSNGEGVQRQSHQLSITRILRLQQSLLEVKMKAIF